MEKTVEELEFGFNRVNCPICGKETLDSYWICKHCGWEYDSVVKKYEYSAANYMTVNKYRKLYRKGKLPFQLKHNNEDKGS